MLLTTDDSNVSALCLLDLMAAFDNVDHDVLTLHLQHQFGLRHVVLQWSSSYLTGRSYHVVFGEGMSSTVHIICIVPQGLVLDQRLLQYNTSLFIWQSSAGLKEKQSHTNKDTHSKLHYWKLVKENVHSIHGQLGKYSHMV